MGSIFTTDIFYMGPDGIGDDQCIKDSGTTQANDKMFSTVAAADANQNADAKPIIADFHKAFPNKTDEAAYTFPAYDCAAILIDAIGRAIKANGGKMPTRQQVVDALATTSGFKGLTGTYTMDKNGDPTPPNHGHLPGQGWSLDLRQAVRSPAANNSSHGRGQQLPPPFFFDF